MRARWTLDRRLAPGVELRTDDTAGPLPCKRLVARGCGGDAVPTGLRGKVLVRIRQVQAEIEVTEVVE